MTDIRKVYSEEVSKGNGGSVNIVEHEYLIPDGQTLSLERFDGGHEHSQREARVTLLERTSGGDDVIDCGYGQNFSRLIAVGFTGDGDRKIVVQLINGDVSALHMTGSWYGRLYNG